MHTVAHRLAWLDQPAAAASAAPGPASAPGSVTPAAGPVTAAPGAGSGGVQRRLEAAYAQAERADDVAAMARVVLAQGGLRVNEQRGAAGDVMLARLRHLARRVDPASSLGLQLRTRLAAENDYLACGSLAILSMLEETTRLDDPAARALALGLAHHCLLGPGTPERAALRRELADELVGESVRTERTGDLLMGLFWQAVDHVVDGDRQAGRRIGELTEALAHCPHRGISYLAGVMDVMLTIRAGDLDRAEARAQECRQQGAAIEDLDALPNFVAHLATIRWYQGRSGELQTLLAQAADSTTPRAIDNSQYGALAVAAAANGDRPAAESAVAALRGRDLRDLPRSSTWLTTLSCLAEAAALLADADTAAEVYELLAPYADLPVIAGPGVVCLGSVQHALGVAALTAGRVDQAVEHLRAAVRRNLVLQHRPAVLMSRARYAQALARRGGPDDLALAREILVVAAQEAGRLGLPLPEFGDRQPEEQPAATCVRDGQQWQLRYGRRHLRLPATVGIAHLAVLLGNPGRDIPAVELAAGPAAVRSTGAPAQPLLGELAAATGLGRRARTFTTDHERARLSVSKAIHRALNAVSRADPMIGEHLRRSVRTGAQCSYRPG